MKAWWEWTEECDLWSEGKVSQSDELFGSDSIKLSIDHSPVWIPVIKLVSLLNTPICLQNIPDVYKKGGHNKQFCNAVHTQTHTHTSRPLSKLKWGLQSDTQGFTAEVCSYRMGVAVLNESKCPNGKTVDPKWGITKRIWIPPTAHRDAGK